MSSEGSGKQFLIALPVASKKRNAMTKLLPLALLAAFWAALLVVFLIPPPANSIGFAHPRHAVVGEKPAMSQGGDGLARHGNLLLRGWLLAAAMIAMLVAMVAFGTRSTGTGAGKIAAFAAGGIAYQAIIVMLFLAYRDSLAADEVAFIGSFPAATWWLLFGVYVIPYYFVALYAWSFDRWIMTPESSQKFEKLLAEYGASKEGGR